ncbi:MAG: bifunctional oligoribonuclease/PAP phosphatase NrnA [Ruminococcus sp.]|nr:bifunctional oligoribonuclease/PAP phosphatase NrnA [Ruminococcus sp.]
MTVKDVCEILKSKNNIEILTHASPDGDTLGCGYALCLALQSMGKNARVIVEKMPQKFKFLTKGVKEQDFQGEFVVSVDIAALSLLGSNAEKYAKIIDLCIDHHGSNSIEIKDKYVVADAAAACEIIYEIIIELGVKITKEIANCLYTGISTDTGCFRFSNTTAQTHRIAADLMEAGCDFEIINKNMFDTKSKARVELEKNLYDTMEYFADGKGAIMCISLDMLEKLNISGDEIEGIENIPRLIEGVLLGITMKEREKNSYKVSVRTNECINASEFCAKFGGGGHIAASGCKINGDYETVKSKLIKAAEEFI